MFFTTYMLCSTMRCTGQWCLIVCLEPTHYRDGVAKINHQLATPSRKSSVSNTISLLTDDLFVYRDGVAN